LPRRLRTIRLELPDADVRGCATGGLRAATDELAGTVLDPEQAAAVVRGQAGIRVLPLTVESTGV